MKNYLLFDNVLGEAKSARIYQLAIEKQEFFARSRTSPNKNYPEWRKSFVLYDGDLQTVFQLIDDEVRARFVFATESLGIPGFQIGITEVQLTSHNDGEYYHWHTDNGTAETRGRVLTFVYYFHCQPRQFTGGELVLYNRTGYEEIEPVHDRLVLFSSSVKHEVKSVHCPSQRFEHGRFTLNGWLRRKSAPQTDYFDAKIFSIPGSIPAASRHGWLGAAASVDNKSAQSPKLHPVSKERPEGGAQAINLLDLYRNLFRKSRQSRSIDVRSQISGEEFFERYYCMNRPVLLEGVLNNSPAVRNWTPDYFADRYGSVPVTVTSGRDSDPDYESNFANTIHTIKLEELVDRLKREPESNDYYLVARNAFFDQPALAQLGKDLQPPTDIINRDDNRAGTIKLWFGPKGTLTPLHYDLHSILFAQIFGKKHFKLIPPFDTPLLYGRQKFYSAVDPENADMVRFPEFSKATVLDVVVKPGDLLFLPVAWWHWVRALDISISATFCSFKEPPG